VPELPVLLLEDAGALVGLLIALGATLLSMATDDAVYDAYGTIAIGVLLGVIAAILIVEMRSLLLGESASPEMKQQIRDVIAGTPKVSRFIHSRTVHLGPEELLVTAKVELDRSLTFPEVAACIDDIEERLRAAVPEARVVYIEPALYDPSRS
jgi:divalent metal cation (Fe/Co/Zn/Cd) transporter